MSKNRIKEIRLKKGITQKELADAVGVTQSYVAKVENGFNGLDIDMLPVLAKALGCKPYDILPLEWQPQISDADIQLLKAIKTLATDNKNEENTKNPQKQNEVER